MATEELEFAKLDVQERCAKIQAALLEKDPMLPQHLAVIHRTLLQYEELVHLLSDDDIKAIIAGQRKHTNVELVKEAITPAKGARVRVPKTTLDML